MSDENRLFARIANLKVKGGNRRDQHQLKQNCKRQVCFHLVLPKPCSARENGAGYRCERNS
ncbi:hypothetical protein [Nitratireductor sp. L15S-10]|uniref:hypothetical protein n=1 Tax=Nitratireductor sp. L15S-10 TaxID=3034028 RepID=UPI00385755CC